MSPGELLRNITAGKFKSAYYFFGSEDYRMVEAEKYVVSQFLPDKQVLTNYRRIDARTTKCPELLAALAAYPMLGEKQVVAVSDFQRYKPTEIDRVLKMLDPPDPHRLVIFRSPSARTPKKSARFFKTICSKAEPIEFAQMTQRESSAMIARKLSDKGLSIEPDALNMLVELTAGNRGGLETETAKIINYMWGQERAITVDDVQAVSCGFESYKVFDLADKIVDGKAKESIAQVRQLLVEGQSATGILYFVGQHYLDLYLVKNNKPLESHRQWLARKYRPQVGKYTNSQLESAITAIAETDAAIRQQQFTPQIAIERLVVRLLENGKENGKTSGKFSGNRAGRNHV